MKLDLAHGDDKTALTVTFQTRVAGRPWLWLGVGLIRLGTLCLRPFGVEARIDTGPWSRVWPRKP